ncbi:hypothetical protein ACIBG5_05690 [Kribbella sp. NPDC050241]|uniref:amino acid kinase family protein n=1 Tax=Kribbella sp. NPDC050241 TaxID=3364115 RepID=UPI00379F059B
MRIVIALGGNALLRRGERPDADIQIARPAVTLVTQTVVDADDPAFGIPTKYVGSGYPEDDARKLALTNGWSVRPDGAQWRRVVPSPVPRRVVELDAAELLLRSGVTVILGGGGGVPVVEDGGRLRGVEAVVDKDLTAALIATELRADLLVMLTDVDAVYLDYGTPAQRPLRDVSTADLAAVTFSAGSMGPKVTAARRFAEGTKGRAAIGSLDDATAVIAGTAGTQIAP